MNHKFTALCLSAVMVAAIFSGCGTAKTEPTAASETTGSTETTVAAQTTVQKAVSRYAELLKAHPTILDQDTEILNDLSFGYEDNLAKFGEHYDYFAVLDLDSDGIPELVASTVINSGWMPVSVFQYQEEQDELQLLKDPLDPEAHATFECMSTAGGTYSLYLCKDNHLHSNWGGNTPIGFQEENHAYVLTESGFASVDCPISNYTGNAADVIVSMPDVMGMNDEATRNAVLDPLM